jgi:hypothetical protein
MREVQISKSHGRNKRIEKARQHGTVNKSTIT